EGAVVAHVHPIDAAPQAESSSGRRLNGHAAVGLAGVKAPALGFALALPGDVARDERAPACEPRPGGIVASDFVGKYRVRKRMQGAFGSLGREIEQAR